MVGEVIVDRYELEELVGTGGMSSVFRARDRLLERSVALKILHEQYSEDKEYVERFRREARAVAQLAHPNIVTVIDRGEQDGRQFIVFEYVDGENLKQFVNREGPLPVREAIELAIQVARALGFAHGRGIVHRDVKPQNVILGEDGAREGDRLRHRALDRRGRRHARPAPSSARATTSRPSRRRARTSTPRPTSTRSASSSTSS